MPTRKPAKLCCVLLCVSLFIFALLTRQHTARAFSGGPDPGRTGAPGELTCATGECHGINRFVALERFRINAPTEYEPGLTYAIEVRHRAVDASRLRWGFQITALTATGARAGSWQPADATAQTVEDARLNRQYAQHTLAGSFAGQGAGASWTIYWTAPSTNVGPITFYAAGNQADNNDNNTGDAIYTTQAVTTPTRAASSPFAASVLVYDLYTSDLARLQTHNTRLSLTNTDPERPVAVHLFLINGETGAVTDHFVCLTARQTVTVLASDLDPNVNGYAIAVACDPATGCPINFNALVGDAFIKFAAGQTANLAAEMLPALGDLSTLCTPGATAATLKFDGIDYALAPRILALHQLVSPLDGDRPLLVLNRLGGDLRTAAAPIGRGIGNLYGDGEGTFGFSFNNGAPQLLRALNNNFAPGLNRVVGAGTGAWLKLRATDEIALLGAALNVSPNIRAVRSAFNSGRPLHHLRLTNTATLTIPIFPPIC